MTTIKEKLERPVSERELHKFVRSQAMLGRQWQNLAEIMQDRAGLNSAVSQAQAQLAAINRDIEIARSAAETARAESLGIVAAGRDEAAGIVAAAQRQLSKAEAAEIMAGETISAAEATAATIVSDAEAQARELTSIFDRLRDRTAV